MGTWAWLLAPALLAAVVVDVLPRWSVHARRRTVVQWLAARRLAG